MQTHFLNHDLFVGHAMETSALAAQKVELWFSVSGLLTQNKKTKIRQEYFSLPEAGPKLDIYAMPHRMS